MQYIFQFGVLYAVYYAGEVIANLTGLPIPGSVFGLLLMLALLRTGAVKPRHVEETADFLIRAMPVMFIPVTTGLMVSYGLLSGYVAVFLGIILVSTVAVFASAGWTAQAIIRYKRRFAPVPLSPPPAGDDAAGEDDV